MNSLPIGIFDSGVGGLTVLRAIRQRLPRESVIYLGDTARVPYGTKSRATIERYAVEDAAFLIEKGVKMIVVACNTASAMGRERLRQEFDTPFLTVLGPGARAAAKATRTGRIGVIATEATINSGAYERAIRDAVQYRDREEAAKNIEVFSRACPLFVPLVEEGETDSQVARLVAEQYLASLRQQRIDTLVLGCTHYPLLKNVIAETMGDSVTLIDSAEAVAEETAELLEQAGQSVENLDTDDKPQESRFYVTDAAERFHRIAERILGAPLEHLEAVEVWGHDKL
ncbi:MAG: glutamate racemase [Acidobacteria bacterium]|nr:glutamate racemase [Acidobacteriota bacterium]